MNMGDQWGYKQPEGPFGLQYTDTVQRAMKGQLPADAFGVRIYDTKRIKGGQAVNQSDFFFFQVPIGATETVLNAPNEQYTKTKQDTNMKVGGLLQKNQVLLINSLQIRITIGAQTSTTYPTSGPGTELATNTTPLAQIGGVNLMTAVLDQTYYVFTIGEADYEDGNGWLFPSRYGLSGWAGTAQSNNNEGAVNSGFGQPYRFPVQRLIPALVYFTVKGEFLQQTTMTNNFTIQAILEGVKFRAVQ